MCRLIVVPTGRAVWHKLNKGIPVTLVSKGLTICSVMTIQGRSFNGEVVGYIMIHRGGQKTQTMKGEIQAAVRKGKSFGVTTWHVKAFQTARSTKTSHFDPDGIHAGIYGECTDVVLVSEVKEFVEPKESDVDMKEMCQVGPTGDDGFTQSEINIDSEGNCSYEERKGLNWNCVMM